MKKFSIIVVVAFLLLISCNNVKNKNITGITVNNNEYTTEFLANNFQNLKSITFKNCDMKNYDIGKLEVYIREIIVSDGCYGELFSSTENYMINRIEINESTITHITSTFLKKVPELQEFISFNSSLEEIDFPENIPLENVDIFNANISNFSSLSNLKSLQSLSISQLEFNSEFDISSISKLSNIENLWLSSNFYLQPEMKLQNIKNLGIVSVNTKSESLEKILQFSSLESLVIQSYYNSEFPFYLVKLPNLINLVLVNTEIEYFPKDLSGFKKLQDMQFINHKVKSFSEDIKFPKTFKNLFINGDSFIIDNFKKKYPNIHFEIIEI